MRKRIIVLLSILLAIVLMGCGEDTAAASADTDSIESAISNALADEVPILLVSVSNKDGQYSLDVSVSSSGKVSSFGNYSLASKSAFEASIPEGQRGRFSVSMAISGNSASLLRFSGDGGAGKDALTGTMVDTRSGETVSTKIESLEDLRKLFPAVKLYVAG